MSDEHTQAIKRGSTDRWPAWPVFLLFAAVFVALPAFVYPSYTDWIVGFICGAISAKWFLIAVLDWADRRYPAGGLSA